MSSPHPCVMIVSLMTRSNETIERVFKEEYGRIIATLIRLSGSFDLAEESLQEAFASAVDRWPREGEPQNAGAWLTTVAHRKLIDSLRREKTKIAKQPELKYEEAGRLHPVEDAPADDAMQYPDDRLRLIFTCCHPSLNPDAQVALTLRTLGGLTTPEIARAFLVPEATMAQRLVRAKNKIKIAGIAYEVPPLESLSQRLSPVQSVLYLIFNEGYSATAGDSLIRKDLCAEAIRLGKLLCQLLPAEPETLGLTALMLLQDSRRDARTDEKGELVTLEEQDRSRWDHAEAEEGFRYLQRASRLRSPGPYQLQAAIAAVHAGSSSAEKTDWAQITRLYETLYRFEPSLIVALNRAVAIAMSEGFEKGLAAVEEVGGHGALDHYPLYHAARADLLRRLGRAPESAEAYRRAIALTMNPAELGISGDVGGGGSKKV
ncbi:MAG: RNA polymerase sigma factor [bacterium]